MLLSVISIVFNISRHIFPKPCPLFSGGANSMDIRYLSFSPDGRHFTTVSDDSYVRFWDILNPAVPVQHAVCDKAFKCSYSAGGDRIALGYVPAMGTSNSLFLIQV